MEKNIIDEMVKDALQFYASCTEQELSESKEPYAKLLGFRSWEHLTHEHVNVEICHEGLPSSADIGVTKYFLGSWFSKPAQDFALCLGRKAKRSFLDIRRLVINKELDKTIVLPDKPGLYLASSCFMSAMALLYLLENITEDKWWYEMYFVIGNRQRVLNGKTPLSELINLISLNDPNMFTPKHDPWFTKDCHGIYQNGSLGDMHKLQASRNFKHNGAKSQVFDDFAVVGKGEDPWFQGLIIKLT